MANHINKGKVGYTRLSSIHPRVKYLLDKDGLDEESMKEFDYQPLCEYCEVKVDMSGEKCGLWIGTTDDQNTGGSDQGRSGG